MVLYYIELEIGGTLLKSGENSFFDGDVDRFFWCLFARYMVLCSKLAMCCTKALLRALESE